MSVRGIGGHGLVEQGALLRVEPLALDAELDAFELGEIEGELVDLGIAPLDLT